jgi:hypothetical protein
VVPARKIHQIQLAHFKGLPHMVFKAIDVLLSSHATRMHEFLELLSSELVASVVNVHRLTLFGNDDEYCVRS